MTFVSGSCKHGDGIEVPECQQTAKASSKVFGSSVEKPKTMFFPKKVGEVVSNVLTQERLCSSLFRKWWAQTGISNDFWIETPEAFSAFM